MATRAVDVAPSFYRLGTSTAFNGGVYAVESNMLLFACSVALFKKTSLFKPGLTCGSKLSARAIGSSFWFSAFLTRFIRPMLPFVTLSALSFNLLHACNSPASSGPIT